MNDEMDEIPQDECMDADDGSCAGPVKLRPGIRLTNVEFAYCEYHWQRKLADADWEGVHEQQHRLDVAAD